MIVLPILGLITLTLTGGTIATLTLTICPNLAGIITAGAILAITAGIGTATVATTAQRPRPQHRRHPIDTWLNGGER